MVETALDILNQWQAELPIYNLSTSGSTGNPSIISHSREALQWSATSTLKTWFNSDNPPIQLCALPLNKAGGFMQIIRSAVWNTPIWIGEPSSNPLMCKESFVLVFPNQFHHSHNRFETHNYNNEIWETHKPSLISLTPMQLANILQCNDASGLLSEMETVLLGGQALDPITEENIVKKFPNTRFIHTFGSTETASHFAGRILSKKKSYYHTTAGTQLQTNELGEIQISNPTTQNKILTLHDQIRIVGEGEFEWLGRTNLLINTGGVKVLIEPLEQQIAQILNWPLYSFYCAGKIHPIWGEQIVLFTLHTEPADEPIFERLSALPNHYKPKQIVRVQQIPMLENGKIDRNN